MLRALSTGRLVAFACLLSCASPGSKSAPRGVRAPCLPIAELRLTYGGQPVLELRRDGSFVQGERVVARLANDEIRDTTGHEILSCEGPDVVLRSLKRQARFDDRGDVVDESDGLRLHVEPDGEISVSMAAHGGYPYGRISGTAIGRDVRRTAIALVVVAMATSGRSP